MGLSQSQSTSLPQRSPCYITDFYLVTHMKKKRKKLPFDMLLPVAIIKF